MNPWEIAALVCRPMSSEEAMRLTVERYGSREFPDLDPLLDAEIRELDAKIQSRERVQKP